MQCFARLVRLLLGSDAVAEEKLECGPSLTVLGVLIELSNKGYTCQPARDKVSPSFKPGAGATGEFVAGAEVVAHNSNGHSRKKIISRRGQQIRRAPLMGREPHVSQV